MSDILLVEIVVHFTILNLLMKWNLVHQWPLVVVQQFILFILKFKMKFSHRFKTMTTTTKISLSYANKCTSVIWDLLRSPACTCVNVRLFSFCKLNTKRLIVLVVNVGYLLWALLVEESSDAHSAKSASSNLHSSARSMEWKWQGPPQRSQALLATLTFSVFKNQHL